MGLKIALIDQQNNSYLFERGQLIINGQNKGKGRLLTPLHKLCLRRPAIFTANGEKLKTYPLKGCMVHN